MKRNLRVEVEGRRWRREGSCRLKHLKAKRGLTLPFGSGGEFETMIRTGVVIERLKFWIFGFARQ